MYSIYSWYFLKTLLILWQLNRIKLTALEGEQLLPLESRIARTQVFVTALAH